MCSSVGILLCQTTQNNSQRKTKNISLFKKKKNAKNPTTFISPSLELENGYSFNLQTLGKYFKCQNTRAECELAHKHQKSEKFTKIL